MPLGTLETHEYLMDFEFRYGPEAGRCAENAAIAALFQKRSVPRAIRSNNGIPFVNPNGFYGLSKLLVGWLRPGAFIERIKPGRLQQNGHHERTQLLEGRSHAAASHEPVTAASPLQRLRRSINV